MNSRTKFNYIGPKNIKDAVKILEKAGKDAVIMAGGTDLLIKIRQKLISPKLIVGLKNIKELKLIHFDEKKGLIIGANVLLSTITTFEKILKLYPSLASAAKSTSNPQIRNMGTIVGNICNASPSADNAPILLAMKSKLNIMGPEGNKIINLENFFVAPGITILKTGEIVTSIIVPIPPNNYGSSYLSLSQKGKSSCTTVGVATMLTLNENKTIETIRIFIGACGPTPIRASKAEKILKKQKINTSLIQEACLEASKEMQPISDIRASKKYRKKMIYVISKRSINQAIKMSENKINKNYKK